jgi:putative membrane protein (TIGR04086 family)
MERSENVVLACVIKGVLTAIITALLGVLIFACVVKITLMQSNSVKIINQIIKIVSVFLGCMVAVRAEKGLLKGSLIGVLSNFLIYAIFALISKTPLFGLSFFIDLIFMAVIGGISGVIAVNIKR